MALRFQDPLSTWGTGSTGRANAIASQNGWLVLGSGFDFTTTNARFVGSYCLKYTSGTAANATFSMAGALATGGWGVAIRPTQLPAVATQIMRITDVAGVHQIAMTLNLDGSFAWSTVNANGTLDPIIGADGPAGSFVPGTYTHCEVKVTIDDTSGEIRVRINNNLVLTATGKDTRRGQANFATVTLMPIATSAFGDVYFSDPFAWDTTGGVVDDFQGNKISLGYFVAADTAQADFALGGSAPAASGYDSLNDAAPNGDVDFIFSNASGQKSRFLPATIDPTLTGIVALTLAHTDRLDSPGTSTLKWGLKNGANFLYGADRNPSYPAWITYFDHFHELPGAVALTPADISATEIQIERTS